MNSELDVKAHLESLYQGLIQEKDRVARMQKAEDFTTHCLGLIDNPDYRTLAQEYMRKYNFSVL